MDAQVTREDTTPELLAGWKNSGTGRQKVAAGLIEQIRAGTLTGELPATADLVKEHGCLQGDVLAAVPGLPGDAEGDGR